MVRVILYDECERNQCTKAFILLLKFVSKTIWSSSLSASIRGKKQMNKYTFKFQKVCKNVPIR